MPNTTQEPPAGPVAIKLGALFKAKDAILTPEEAEAIARGIRENRRLAGLLAETAEASVRAKWRREEAEFVKTPAGVTRESIARRHSLEEAQVAA